MKDREHGDLLPLHLLALRIRALVLALGETASPPWWATEFMNETGFRFLERLYPRTAFRASVHAAGKAACDAHDRAVGRVGAYHLFRLPEGMEIEMSRLPPDADREFVEKFRKHLGERDELAAMLADLSNGKTPDESAAGAKLIGADDDLRTPRIFSKMAGLYLSAFSEGKPVYPYFSAALSEGAES